MSEPEKGITSGQSDSLASVISALTPRMSDLNISTMLAWGAEKVAWVCVDMASQRIVYATEGAEKLFGYIEDEMLGIELLNLVADSSKSVHEENVKNFNLNPSDRMMGERGMVLMGKRRDGSVFSAAIGLYPRVLGQHRICLANVVEVK